MRRAGETPSIRWWALLVLGYLGVVRVLAEGIPEPSLVMYGVIQRTGGPKLTFGTLTWTFKPPSGGAPILIPVSLENINDQFSYVLRVPCETVLAGMQPSSNALQLSASPITYDRSQVVVNGETAAYSQPQLTNFTLAATDRGLFHRVDLNLQSAGPDFPTWATIYFGTPNVDPNADPDGDGASNFAEYKAGTIPTNNQSVFEFIEILSDPAGGIQIRWSSVSNKTYTVQRSLDLQTGFTNIKTGESTTPPVNSYRDATAIGPGPYFYRLLVE